MDWSFLLRAACERHGSRLAIRYRDLTLSFEELEHQIAAIAGGLQELPHGPVASLLANVPVAIELPMALARSGRVGVPVNGRLTADEMEYILRDSRVKSVIVDSDSLPRAIELRKRIGDLQIVLSGGGDLSPGVLELKQLQGAGNARTSGAREVPDEQTASIIYTSGTSGFPKGVLRTHRANAWNIANSALGSPRTPQDRELFNLPAFGIGLLHFAIPALLCGATVILDHSFHPDRVWQILREQEVSRTFLAPTMIDSMLGSEQDDGDPLPRLQIIYTAYEFSARLRQRALARFGNRFVNMYGLTEAQLTCAQPGEFERKPTSVGKSMGAMRIAILDEKGSELARGETGEIAIGGPASMSGYHGLEAETASALREDWVLTGDLGYVDQDGDLHFCGRKKDIIKTGGFSVDPVEVENAVLTLASVAEASVIGVPDDHWGEMVIAFVVAADGAMPPSEAQVREACRQRLASFKVPKAVQVLPALPKNATGKVERGRLRASWSPGSTNPTPTVQTTT